MFIAGDLINGRIEILKDLINELHKKKFFNYTKWKCLHSELNFLTSLKVVYDKQIESMIRGSKNV